MTSAAKAVSRPRSEPAAVLTRALLRTASSLGLSQKDTARIIGVSTASMSRVAAGERTLAPDSKEGELALLLIRLFRSLDALVGGKEEDARAWLHASNSHLGGGVPAARVQTIEGLVHVAEYLDAMRGKL
jgi:transcriptional regulator with XRE-family HTH domain